MGDRTAALSHAQWLRKRKRWQADFPWLCSAQSAGGRWGLGCVACHAAGADGVMAKFRCSRYPLLRALFVQHDKTAAHRAAMEGVRQGATAPSAEHFRPVLGAIRSNQHRQPISGVAGLHKISKMRWCLAEAARELDRRFLRTAASVTVFQDGRKGALLVRFKGANKRLDTRRGVLGIARVHGDAFALREATLTVLRRFCTSMRGAPCRT